MLCLSNIPCAICAYFSSFFFLPVSLVAVVGLEVTQTVIVLHLDKIPTAWKI